ncbi:MAG: hypothetical protein CMI29_01480 [Opitutae bacterium]|nr:hypothetical protein [Opitutae bacterium]
MTSVATIQQYVNNPPYYGRSHPRDCARVKELCGPTRKFDFERKLWATRCTDALRALVASKKWQPVGIDKEANAPLMRAAVEHRARAEAEWKAAEEARKAQEEEERKRLVVEEAIKMSKKKAREAEAAIAELKAKRQKRAAEAKAVAVLPFASKPKPVPAAAAAASAKEEKRDGIDPSEAEVAECARLGFTAQAIAYSRTLTKLGPRGSLSDEGRVLRYCLLTCDADESVRELSRDERRRSWGGSEVRWTLPETASRAYAKELADDAKAAAEQGVAYA